MRFSTVCGERMFANTNLESSRIAIVPFGDRFGEPSDDTVATYPNY